MKAYQTKSEMIEAYVKAFNAEYLGRPGKHFDAQTVERVCVGRWNRADAEYVGIDTSGWDCNQTPMIDSFGYVA